MFVSKHLQYKDKNTEAQIAHSRKKVLGRRAETETIRWLIASGCFWNLLDIFGILWILLEFAGFLFKEKHSKAHKKSLKKHTKTIKQYQTHSKTI